MLTASILGCLTFLFSFNKESLFLQYEKENSYDVYKMTTAI